MMKEYIKHKINSTVVFSLSILNLVYCQNAFSESTGRVGYTNNPQQNNSETCFTRCHTGGVAPDVTITGPSSVKPNSVNHYKLTITGGQKNVSGLNISTDKGLLISNDKKTYTKLNTATQIYEITQSNPKGVSLDGTTIDWFFDWQAPAIIDNTSTIYATVVSANSDGDKAGDNGATIKFAVSVVSSLPEPSKPIAKVVAPFNSQLGEFVIFDASKSVVQDGFIYKYLWTFSDGTTDTKSQTFFRFDTLGVKTVNLTVTSDSGLIDKTFIDINVVDTANGGLLNPIAVLTGSTSSEINKPITFDTTGSTINNNTQYLYDFGDGSPISTVPTHQYTIPSNYTVTLAVQEGQLTTTATSNIKITPATQTTKTGESVFKTNCETCHGVAGVGIIGKAKNIKGATALFIDNALVNITTHITQGISLPAGDSQLVADYLGIDGVGTGSSLYVARCQICHGDIGVGIIGVGKNIQNTTATLITNAINATTTPPAVVLMAGIKLSAAEAGLIVNYLAVTTSNTGKLIYETNCLSCHGIAGIGGSAKVVINASVTMINNAIATIPSMNTIAIKALTTSDIQLLVDYLVGQAPGDAATGELTYIFKCQMCHGTGTGGLAKNILRASAVMTDTAIATVPEMKSIKLSPVEKDDLVSMLLRGPIAKPTTGSGLYTMYCSYCHGPTGMGGPATIAKFSLRGRTTIVADIKAAYTGGELIMSNSNLRNAGLLDPELQLIINYLK